MPTEREDLAMLGCAIEKHLFQIEKLLSKNYKLTLVARHTGTLPDADIIMSVDDLDAAIGAIRKLQGRPDRVIEPEGKSRSVERVNGI